MSAKNEKIDTSKIRKTEAGKVEHFFLNGQGKERRCVVRGTQDFLGGNALFLSVTAFHVHEGGVGGEHAYHFECACKPTLKLDDIKAIVAGLENGLMPFDLHEVRAPEAEDQTLAPDAAKRKSKGPKPAAPKAAKPAAKPASKPVKPVAKPAGAKPVSKAKPAGAKPVKKAA